MLLREWSDVLVGSFQDLWQQIVEFLPNIVVSIIIFIVGWVIASVLAKWIAQVIRALKLDNILQSLGVQDLVNRAGYKLDSGTFIGALVKLFVIVVFLVAALDVLGLPQINDFLSTVILAYIPKVISAAIILLIAAVAADILQRLVSGSARAAGMHHSDLLGGITKWAIWIFGLLAALNELQIGAVFAQTIFTGLIAMLAIAGGLAFGLGGRDAAAQYIDKLRKDIGKRD